MAIDVTYTEARANLARLWEVRREAVFQPEFREDLRYWVDVDRKVALRAFDLIEAILRDPFRGIAP